MSEILMIAGSVVLLVSILPNVWDRDPQPARQEDDQVREQLRATNAIPSRDASARRPVDCIEASRLCIEGSP